MPPARAPRVAALADAILLRIGLLNNPYFTALADGSMPLETFRRGQEQFFFAVRYFARPMAALVARIPEPAHRLDLLRNIVEEHGDFQETRFHQNTFRDFLKSIGAHDAGAGTFKPSPAVHAFNSILMGACIADELEIGIACVGIIEYAFADVSALIGKAVVDRGWLSSEQLMHYALHAELDIRHADEFFALLEPKFDDVQRWSAIKQGLELGAYAFDQLYRSLLQ
ncbi:MAG TPA: iron-containing redox enzyme family protein [Tepidisphaeraceae bacterium]|nr:iron-containing redox enzyme family protein [Tepidisphaeraceae bacterium]